MNFIIIIITCIVICILLAVIFELNPKKSKQIAENKELNELAKKYPSNLNICKDILKMLKNEKVNIEEDNETKDCIYMVAFNKIVISGTQDNFTRIQTIAHECIHSVQSKKIQMLNFIMSNICILYFIVTIALEIFKILPEKMLFLSIYILLGFTHFMIRAYLENDAMIKAKYLAKDYMKMNGSCNEAEIDKIVNGFEQINDMGIKGYNFSLLLGVLFRVIILAGVLFII